MWHDLLHNWFIAAGFEVNPHDCCLYTKWEDGVPLHCLVHVRTYYLPATVVHDNCVSLSCTNRTMSG